MFEVNFDGIIGPTHNYGGLSEGNIASISNSQNPANPKKAALQGLKKMKILRDAGLIQGVFLPHERPYLAKMREMGFTGSDKQIINKVASHSPHLLHNLYSASSMWSANAATVSPSVDTADQKIHITPANLNAMFHRSIESDFTYHQCLQIFKNESFKIHKPVPPISGYGDEGAANHLRVASNHEQKGFEIFIFGTSAFKAYNSSIMRQAKEISHTVALKHQLNTEHYFLLQQNQDAIQQGSFHNDIVSLSNENIFIAHEKAFEDRNALNQIIRILENNVSNFQFIEIKENEIPLKDIIKSYLLNSQLVSTTDGEMLMVLPADVQNFDNCMQWIDKLKQISPVKKFEFVDIKQSMMNGGGPACLRLKVLMNNKELEGLNKNFILDDNKIEQIKHLIQSFYRDRILPDDLKDPDLLDEFQMILDQYTQIFGLENFYSFQ